MTSSQGTARTSLTSARRNLHIVTKTHRPIDISALMSADIPDAEHWRKVHIAGDRRPPVEIGDTRKARWLDL